MNTKTGFTLIELLVTITVSSLVLSVSAPRFFHMIEKNNFEIEAEEIIERFFDLRSIALSGKNCEEEGNPPDYKFSVGSGGLTITGCFEDLVLEHSLVLPGTSSLTTSFQRDPFQMILKSSGSVLTQSFYRIESTNLDTPETWTVCLKAVKGFPEVYDFECDCWAEDSTLIDCS